MAGYVDSGNAQASLGGISTAQRFMEMQMQQQQQARQNERQGMFDQIAMRQADREQNEYQQQQAHKKQMAEVKRSYLLSRFKFGGPNDSMGGPGAASGQQTMAPEQMAMMEANAGQMPPPDPRNAKAQDVLPAMGVDPNLEPWQQNIKSLIENGDDDTLTALIPYVQDQDGFIKAQAIAQAVSTGKLDGNLLADPKDRAYFQFLAKHRPEAVMGEVENLFRSQRQKQDQLDEEKRRNQYAMEAEGRADTRQISSENRHLKYTTDAEERANKRQIDAEGRAITNDQTRGQNALKQSLDARRQQDQYESDQWGPAARMVTTEPPGDGMGPPQVNEPEYATLNSLPPRARGNAIMNKFGAQQEARNRRGVADNLRNAGMGSSEAELMAATSSGGRINPSVASGLFNNKSEQAASQQRLRAAQDTYRKTGAGVFKDKGKAITTPGSLAPPTPDEVAKARKGDQRSAAKVRAWNDLIQAKQEVEQAGSGGMFSGVKQGGDALDSLIDEAMGGDELDSMIQLGE